MNEGNYSFEDLVRIDCDLPPKEFLLSAVHEVAHFTLTKQTAFGLLCFFLSQNSDLGGSDLNQTLHLLERASEGVQESYARTMELIWGTGFLSLSTDKRKHVLEEQQRQSYYFRYRMDLLEPLLLHYEQEAISPVFPHDLFFMAANIDITPLLQAGLKDPSKILKILQQYPKRFQPDHRFRLLVQTYLTLRRKLPAMLIHPKRLAAECGLDYDANIYAHLPQLLSLMASSDDFLPQTRMLMMENANNLKHYKASPLKKKEIDDAIRLSLYDYVIPFALGDRFNHTKSVQPVFRDHKNVLAVYLQPDKAFGAELVRYVTVPGGQRSALLCFVDTKAGTRYSGAYAADLKDYILPLRCYPGTVWLYLDDYEAFRSMGLPHPKRVFFRCDASWCQFTSEIQKHGIKLDRFFLQRYTDSTIFFFGYDSYDNVVFSMFANWELPKITSAVSIGSYRPCAYTEPSQFRNHPWYAFRDLIAAVTENSEYSSLTLQHSWTCGSYNRPYPSPAANGRAMFMQQAAALKGGRSQAVICRFSCSTS